MKVLIISLDFHTAEGTLAKGIASAITNHEIYFCSIAEFKYRAQEIDQLIQYVDVVHWLFNVGHLNEVKGKYFNAHNTPTIATVHHVCEQEQYKITAAAKASLIHVVSSEWKFEIEKFTNTPVQLASMGMTPDNVKAIIPLPYSRTPFKIGMIGYYPGAHNRKRMDIALSVFKQLAEESAPFEVVLQGDGWDNQISFFQENNIPVSYTKLTRTSNVFDFYGKIHALLCTSDYEGGPLPVLEALNFGIPVVSTRVGIAIDALSLGGGLLNNKGDITGLTESIRSLIKNKDLYDKLQSETKQIAPRFYWKNLIKEYDHLYEVAGSPKSPSAISSLNINATDQRKRELVFDKIHEGQQLVLRKRFKEAGSVFLIPFLSSQVTISRKIGMVKYMINGMRNKIKR